MKLCQIEWNQIAAEVGQVWLEFPLGIMTAKLVIKVTKLGIIGPKNLIIGAKH